MASTFSSLPQFPLYSAERQLGRLRKLRVPDFVGFNPVDLSIRAKEKDGQTYLGMMGHGIQKHKEVKRNPNTSREVLEKVKAHVEHYAHRYLNVKWFA